jgi:hypothetical protein
VCGNRASRSVLFAALAAKVAHVVNPSAGDYRALFAITREGPADRGRLEMIVTDETALRYLTSFVAAITNAMRS